MNTRITINTASVPKSENESDVYKRQVPVLADESVFSPQDALTIMQMLSLIHI